MIQTIKGYYYHGEIVLEEKPDIDEKVPVWLNFGNFNETVKKPTKKGMKIGGLEGKYTVPDNFNEPLDDLKDYM